MFVNLPIFLAIGAALGFAWAKYGREDRRRPFRPNAFAVIYVLVFAGAVFSQMPVWARFDLGVLLLGGATGRWFAYSYNDRDKGILLGFAGILVVVAALQYDLGILNGLTKFGAGSVSVEFTGSKQTRPWQSPQTEPGVLAGSAFPGTGRLDIAVGIYKNLAGYIERDERYARVFASEKPGYEGNAFDGEVLDPRMDAFKAYANETIVKIGTELAMLQSYQRSEESTLNFLPEMAASLRRSYETALGSGDPNDNSAVGVGPSEGMGGLQDSLRYELGSLCRMPKIRDHVESCVLDPHHPTCAPKELSELVTFCKTDTRIALKPPEAVLFKVVPRWNVDGEYRYFAYFAIVVAAAEYAIGNRENAIQILEREVRRQMASTSFESRGAPVFGPCPSLPAAAGGATPDASQGDECRLAKESRLEWFRRLFVISRLESIEDSLIAASENPAETSIRIETLKRSIALYDRAFRAAENGAATHPELFEGAFAENVGASCAAPGSGSQSQRDSGATSDLAAIAYNRIAVENDASWLAATDREIILAEPFRLGEIQQYVEELARFDVGCLPTLGYSIDSLAVRWQHLPTASAFWLLEGQRFGLLPDEATARLGLTSTHALEVLCKAQTANRLALRAFYAQAGEQGGLEDNSLLSPDADDAASWLDRRVNHFTRASEEVRLLERSTQIENAFNDYTQGQRESVCGK